MAHELDESNGKYNMAYVGDKPWHGLGQELTPDSPLDVWCKEAGMDWTVEKADCLFNVGGESSNIQYPNLSRPQNIRKFEKRNVLYRSDTYAGLGVVSDNYKIVQPKEALEFFKDLIADHGFTMETAGCLFGGKKFWALAKCGKSFKINGEDEIKPYLMMASSADGTMSTAVHLTSVRVVCNNTLQMCIGANAEKSKIKIPHQATFDANAVKQQLDIVGGAWDKFKDNVIYLSEKRITRDEAILTVGEELNIKHTVVDDVMASSQILRNIISLYDGKGIGANMVSANGTAWGLVNAVTQFFDHETGSKIDKSRAFERANFTDRSQFKIKIANRLLRVA